MNNRIIKFRAYDPQTKEMFLNLDWDKKTAIFFDVKDSCLSVTRSNPETGDTYSLIPQQFTGLKDKNGVDVYEGDVISVPYVDPMGQLHEGQENYKAIVEFSNGSFVHKSYTGHRQILLSNWCKPDKTEYVSNVGEVTTYLPETHLTIIGNIYQNPELLNL